MSHVTRAVSMAIFAIFGFFFWKFIKNMGQKLGSNKRYGAQRSNEKTPA